MWPAWLLHVHSGRVRGALLPHQPSVRHCSTGRLGPDMSDPAALDGMPPGMAKLDSLDLSGVDGGMLLHDLPMEQQRALGLHGGLSYMTRANSGLQSMQSIEHALGDVEAVRSPMPPQPGPPLPPPCNLLPGGCRFARLQVDHAHAHVLWGPLAEDKSCCMPAVSCAEVQSRSPGLICTGHLHSLHCSLAS